jgi:hypothetical protein
MKPYRVIWTVLVSATLVLPGARPVSAQTVNEPPAQTPGGPSAERNDLIVGIGAAGALHRIRERTVTADKVDRSAFAVGTNFKIGDATTGRSDSANAAIADSESAPAGPSAEVPSADADTEDCIEPEAGRALQQQRPMPRPSRRAIAIVGLLLLVIAVITGAVGG